MRRLFWTFPGGLPGAGLLVMRLVTGVALIDRCIVGAREISSFEAGVILSLTALTAALLLVGLWTPIAAVLVAGVELWRSVSQPGDPWIHILVGTLAAALALLGPGAWSADARLFGWKRIDVPDRRSDHPPS